MAALEHPWDIPAEYTLWKIDIRKSSDVPEPLQPALKERFDAILSSAFSRSGLAEEWSDPVYRRDDGDGYTAAFAPARTWRLIDPLTRYLDQELHNYRIDKSATDPELQVRTAVHIGPFPDSRLSDTINDASRFVDSTTARTGLEAAVENGGHTALIVSDEMFQRVIEKGRSQLTADEHFLRIPATEVPGKNFGKPSWLHVPRVSPETLADFFERHLPHWRSTSPGEPSLLQAPKTPPGGQQNSETVNIQTMANRIASLHTLQINQPSTVTVPMQGANPQC
ncbi:hypothetical protein AB0O31_17825 [Kitasatospora cineracea]|uniref:hypothetical protein n=1 Tax=Kitasatospora cineracea TaxID=88074 RepID=UPI00341F0CD8